MRVNLQLHSLFLKLQVLPLFVAMCLWAPAVPAEVINIPIQRSVATQPITSLEIIAIVKSLLYGRVLSIKKQSSYDNPDCHLVKLLEDKGEFQIIRLGCFIDTVVQVKQR